MKTQALIDGDFYLLQACTVVEKDTCFPIFEQAKDDEGNLLWMGHTDVDDNPIPMMTQVPGTTHILHSDEDEALEVFKGMVRKNAKAVGADEIVLVFSGNDNFRKRLWHLYKSNRKANRKPLCYRSLIERLESGVDGLGWKVVSHPVLEGDDYCGLLATRPSSVKKVIVSADKDFQTLPNVWFYRTLESGSTMIRTTEESAERFWFQQVLEGDSTDGYKGCPGVGKVSVEAILNGTGDRWSNVLEAYRKACGKKPQALLDAELGEDATADDFALLTARLARILRHGDFVDGEVVLWTPEPLE